MLILSYLSFNILTYYHISIYR